MDDDTGLTLGRFVGLLGFFVGQSGGDDPFNVGGAGRVELDFEIEGMSVGQGALRSLLAKGRKNLVLQVLSSDLVPIGEYYVASASVTLATGEQHPRSENLTDLRVDGYLDWTPRSEARAIWESWAEARPTERGLWANLPVGSREAWLEVAMLFRQKDLSRQSIIDTPSAREYFMDGAQIEDLASFFCALGEAIEGPGGYYGWTLAALADLLKSDARARAPFVLYWNDFDLARHALSERTRNDSKMTLELILECLGEGGVDVRCT